MCALEQTDLEESNHGVKWPDIPNIAESLIIIIIFTYEQHNSVTKYFTFFCD